MPNDDQTQLRAATIDMVLATDMKRHFAILSRFQTVFQRKSSSNQGHRLSASGTASPRKDTMWEDVAAEDRSLARLVCGTQRMEASCCQISAVCAAQRVEFSCGCVSAVMLHTCSEVS